jgi:4-amino-4-deoxy-L-arabinose transferase-like glycosyltransferase
MKKEATAAFISLKLPQILRYTLFSITAAYLIIYLWMAFQRLRYPFDLEWIEGGLVNQVQRLLQGQRMYVAPDINFVPFLYPPVYFYFSALAALLFGIGFFPLRLVSFIASLVSFTTIFLIVRAETKNGWAAILSAGLFAATFRVTGAWLDIARVDSLFLALWLVFIYVVRGGKSLGGAVLAGVLAALAYLTKQTALITCVPVLVYLFWCDWKYALACLAAATLTVGVTTLVMNHASAGWYGYYVFGLLSQQTEWLPQEFLSFWKDDLLVHLPVAILIATFFLLGRPKPERLSLWQWLSILAGGLAGSFITRVKIGGFENVLLPAYAVLSILFGLGLGGMLRSIKPLQADTRGRLEGMIHTACLIQLVLLFYNPFAQIPTQADLDAGNALVKTLSEVHGPVFVPDHSYLPVLAGKDSYANNSAIWDVLRGNQLTKGKTTLATEIDNAIRQQSFDEIIVDGDLDLYWCCSGIDQYYTRVGELFQDQKTFYTVTGDKKRPTYIYIANRLR